MGWLGHMPWPNALLRVKPACTGVEEDHGLVYIGSIDAMIEAY